jgi:hypothetical protein
MYRIELAPGEVTVFRTIEELATGVRNGVISSRARIFHNASQKWLPIEFHPHYKLALELLAGRSIEVPTPKHEQGPRFDLVPTPGASGAANAPRAGGPSDAQPAPTAAHKPMAPAHDLPAPTRATQSSSPADAGSVSVIPAPVATAPFVTRTGELPWLEPASTERPPVESARVEQPPVQLPWAQRPPVELPWAERPSAKPSWVEQHQVEQPSAAASPVLDLPDISYPEITPAEEPVAESSVGRGRRPLHLFGAVVVLALGAYAARSTFTSAETPPPVVADRPAVPEADSASVPAAIAATPAPAPTATRAAVPSPAPRTPMAPAAPATSGFAPALEPRAIVATPAPGPAAAAQDSVTPIAPAPIEVDLSVPALAGSESLVATPKQRGDSAMKRILRAVSGGKESAPRP